MPKTTKTPEESETNDALKRERYRTSLFCPVVFQFLEEGKAKGPLCIGTTVNLNTTGALLRTDKPYEMDSLLQLEITVPWAKAILRARGRLTRVQEEKRGKQYLLGVHFEELDSTKPMEFLQRLESQEFQHLLEELLKTGGSDLHLTIGTPPTARIQGNLTPLKWPAFQPGEIGAFLYSLMTEEQIALFEQRKEIDFAYSLEMNKRFRVNLHRQRGQIEAAIRVVPNQMGDPAQLSLPPIVAEWSRKPEGLVLIAGSTGAGKTTTLNAMVDMINRERQAIVICLERPIEYAHTNRRSLIKQREVGTDTLSYAEAVRQALRQDPDVIVVGEIENQETVEAVLNAAQAGNLVLASIHGTNTERALDRFVSLCPPQERQQVAFQLASCLLGVLTQQLFPREAGTGTGLALATELFVMTDAAQTHIRGNNLTQIRSDIETGGALKMYTLESSIQQLVDKGVVSPAVMNKYRLESNRAPVAG